MKRTRIAVVLSVLLASWGTDTAWAAKPAPKPSAHATAASGAQTLLLGRSAYALEESGGSEKGDQYFSYRAPAKHGADLPDEVELYMSKKEPPSEVDSYMLGGVLGLMDGGGRVVEAGVAGTKGPRDSKLYLMEGELHDEDPSDARYVVTLWRHQEGRVFKTVLRYKYKSAAALAALEKKAARDKQVALLISVALPSVAELSKAASSAAAPSKP